MNAIMLTQVWMDGYGKEHREPVIVGVAAIQYAEQIQHATCGAKTVVALETRTYSVAESLTEVFTAINGKDSVLKLENDRLHAKLGTLGTELEKERNERRSIQALYDALKVSTAKPVDLNRCAVCGKDPGVHCYVTKSGVMCDGCYEQTQILGGGEIRMDNEDMMETHDGNAVPPPEPGRG